MSKKIYQCDYCGKDVDGDHARSAGDFDTLCPQCYTNDKWKRRLDDREMPSHLRRCPNDRAFVGREPTFGDPDQIRVLNALNGDGLYCDVCAHVIPSSDVSTVGSPCPNEHCPGHMMPGAAITKEWMEFAGITEGALA
jgi:hypothetical protein